MKPSQATINDHAQRVQSTLCMEDSCEESLMQGGQHGWTCAKHDPNKVRPRITKKKLKRKPDHMKITSCDLAGIPAFVE